MFSITFYTNTTNTTTSSSSGSRSRQKQTKRLREKETIKMCVCVGTFFGDEKKNRFENPFFHYFDPVALFHHATNIENISDDFFPVRSFVVSSRNYFSPAVTINHDFGVVFGFFSLFFVSKRAHTEKFRLF